MIRPHLLNTGWLLAASFLLAGCNFLRPNLSTAITPTATFTPIPSPAVTPTQNDPGGWVQIRPGLEKRTLEIKEDQQHLESIYILRISPDDFRFEVAYHPQGLTLEDWQAQTGALIVVNGGYFRQEGEDYVPNGLTIIDGSAMGGSYGDFGGMLAVSENGPQLRWLAQQPHDPNEPLLAALQSFPILVKPGGEMGYPPEHEDHVKARRTIIAQDQQGHILLMVAPRGNLTLHQLSAALTNADLDLDIAINLDGGPSSGILLAAPLEKIPAISPLPVVITVSLP